MLNLLVVKMVHGKCAIHVAVYRFHNHHSLCYHFLSILLIAMFIR